MEEGAVLRLWEAEEDEGRLSEEEKKEGDDSTFDTIKRLQLCCNTMAEFHKQGIEIKDIAAKAGAYIKDLVGDSSTIDVTIEKNKKVVLVDLSQDADEGVVYEY